MKKSALFAFFMFIGFCVVVQSCGGSDNIIDEPGEGKAQMQVSVDWSCYGKSSPSVFTLLCHNVATGELVRAFNDGSDLSYASLNLPSGSYCIAVLNIDAENSNAIGLRGLESAETAEVYALELVESPKWHKNSVDGDSYQAVEPEWLAVDTIMTASLDHVGEVSGPIGTLHPENIVYSLQITVRSCNISDISAVRAAISGMASGRRIASDRPIEAKVTQLIESNRWSRLSTPSESEKDFGQLEAELRCFGLPSGHSGNPEENILEFQALHADGHTVTNYRIPVGHIIEEVAPGRRGDNLRLRLCLTLDTPLPPGGGGSGFDIWIENPDEYEDFEVPI